MAARRLGRVWNPLSTQRHANVSRLLIKTRFFTQSSCTQDVQGVNAPLQLDQSMVDLLRDADMAIHRHKSQSSEPGPRHLEVVVNDSEEYAHITEHPVEDATEWKPGQRRSPEARFGSHGLGSVVLPVELVKVIETLIHERDKHTLHNDAKRLFSTSRDEDTSTWHTKYETHYKSRKQAARHADRDGTAFASVALPAHFSAILAVLEHVKHRLERTWTIDGIIEWGSAVGSGLWASVYSFQQDNYSDRSSEVNPPALTRSTIKTYLGIDERVGLTSMAKRLVKDIDFGEVQMRWKRGLSDSDGIDRSHGGSTLALSAFYLSTLHTPLARKAAVKEMWRSGADVIVLIDHDSPAGFESIAEAREYLLRMGKKESEDSSIPDGEIAGCHVIAPCPHDGICPLHRNNAKSSVRCTFSQRIQRPSFVRKTKHVSAGHEDVGYSYVVIRRGRRPLTTEKHLSKLPEMNDLRTGAQHADQADNTRAAEPTPRSGQVDEAMRLQAFTWPRLVFPPLKRSGHIIMDCCTPQGQIMRMTIPKSQGKQEYYDARKSSWGDIFPHPPKNPPQVRMQSPDGKSIINEGIGKRKAPTTGRSPSSYGTLMNDIKDAQKERRRHLNKQRQGFE